VFIGKDNSEKFKCHGCGVGGDIFKLVQEVEKLNFKEAKEVLMSYANLQKPFTFSFPQEQNTPYPQTTQASTQKDTRTIKKVQQIENKALLSYLHSRGITEVTGVQEIYYTLKTKDKTNNLFGVAFENDSHGFEVSSKNPQGGSFKTAFGTKDITTIINNSSSKSIKIFEGFIDYLSYLQIEPRAKISNFIILNSVSLYENAINSIKGKFELLELYLDNDKAGAETTSKFIGDERILYCNSTLIKIVDHRKTYKNFKDINEFLLSKA
jgi:DNA primase